MLNSILEVIKTIDQSEDDDEDQKSEEAKIESMLLNDENFDEISYNAEKNSYYQQLKKGNNDVSQLIAKFNEHLPVLLSIFSESCLLNLTIS